MGAFSSNICVCEEDTQNDMLFDGNTEREAKRI